uniref:Mitogen-activated protein kinase n=1 Tax=Zooxanthella nutricula TaxID=1333877 RepID=A0A7S2HQN9_9DINO
MPCRASTGATRGRQHGGLRNVRLGAAGGCVGRQVRPGRRAMPIYDLHEVVVDAKADGKSTFRVPKHLELVKKVGSGAYGCVASFKDARTGDKIAVKKITNAFDDLVDGKRILREVKLLRHFDHDNIIRILDMLPPPSPDFQDIYIVTDLMETDLHRVIYSKQPLTEEHHQYFVHQLLRGLVYLHTAHVVHRDLKPSNLLVNKNCDLKICDFGLARVLTLQEQEARAPTDYVVTRWYRAPEVVLLASEYTVSIDVWAVGCILCELINRRPIFAGKDHLDQIKKIVGVLGSPTEEELHWLPRNGSARAFLKKCPLAPRAAWSKLFPSASQQAIEVIEGMLKFDPTVRITVQDGLRLKYFENLFEEEDMEQDTRVAPVDWAFDNFEPTKTLLQNYVYCECASFHREIVERDQTVVQQRGIDKLLSRATGAAPARAGAAATREDAAHRSM